jgi:hypothetical protein
MVVMYDAANPAVITGVSDLMQTEAELVAGIALIG